MNTYKSNLYIDLVEKMNDAGLQNYMKKEIEFLKHIPNSKKRTFIDLGAGYGRVEEELSSIARDVIAIELQDTMFAELKRRSNRLPNVTALQVDMTKLKQALLGPSLSKPVFIVLQNTLGTVEGDINEFLLRLKNIAKETDGEIVLSLFKQEDFMNWGLQMYKKAKPMIGKVDLEKSDIKRGRITSDTGYVSKWWNKSDLDNLKAGCGLKDEKTGTGYYILRLKP